MEIWKVIPLPISPQLKEKMERDKKHKEESSKTFGDYLISITNVCFDKCINTDNIFMTKQEEKCIAEFFNKFTDAHIYSFYKFKNINNLIDENNNHSHLDRSKDYGDYYGFLGYIFREDIENIKSKFKPSLH